MTQEELDALMAGGFEDDDVATMEEEPIADEAECNTTTPKIDESELPPRATENNKIVNQLDSVTKDSEIKATEIFDRLDGINEYLANIDSDSAKIRDVLNSNIELFEKLSSNYESIEIFKKLHENNKEAIKYLDDGVNQSQMSSDEILMIMDTMQFQDIHRQKIERVINVMRSLLKYMNTLFGSEIEDGSRTSSAKYIEGDTDTMELVTNEDIEAMLNSFSK